jgi:hypothetical protein
MQRGASERLRAGRPPVRTCVPALQDDDLLARLALVDQHGAAKYIRRVPSSDTAARSASVSTEDARLTRTSALTDPASPRAPRRQRP